jgi:hypothetical protein
VVGGGDFVHLLACLGTRMAIATEGLLCHGNYLKTSCLEHLTMKISLEVFIMEEYEWHLLGTVEQLLKPENTKDRIQSTL